MRQPDPADAWPPTAKPVMISPDPNTKFRIACTHCGKWLVVNESMIGKRGKCPNCRTPVLVAKPSPAPSAPLVVNPPVAREVTPEEAEKRRVFDGVQAGIIIQNRLGMAPGRFFGQSLGKPLFGHEIPASVYGGNPFRFLGLQAAADHGIVSSAASRLRAVSKLNPAGAQKMFIRVGYDGHLQASDPLARVEDLDDPRRRLLAEVFWPHIAEEDFNQIKDLKHLVCEDFIQKMYRRTKQVNGHEGALAKHTLAVQLHNLAISQEMAYASGHVGANHGCWKKALDIWKDVFDADEFWEYLRKRAKSFDDPRIRSEDVDALKDALPSLILGFNRLFARAYATANENEACWRQLKLVSSSGFSEACRRDALISTVQMVTSRRLEPLILYAEDPVENPLPDAASLPSPNREGKYKRRDFQQIYEPLLNEATKVRDFLVVDLKISEGIVALAEFDRFCTAMQKAVNTKLEYQDDDRLRSILYSILFVKQLTKLPLSDSLRRQVEQSRREDIEILYRGYTSGKATVDPTECWFLPGESATPEDSIELPVYKITKLTAGSCQWESRKVLVPRSALAAKFHRGQLTKKQLAKERNSEKSQATQQRCHQILADRDARLRSITQQSDERIQQVNAECLRRQQEHAAQWGARAVALETEIAKYETVCRKKASDEMAQCHIACETVRQQHQAEIYAEQRKFDSAVGRLRGLGGLLQIELPLSIPCAAVVGIAAAATYYADILAKVQGRSKAIDDLAARVGGGPLITMGAVVLGGLLLLLTGRIIRKRKRQHARLSVDNRTAIRDREIADLQAKSHESVALLEAELEQRVQKWREELRHIRQHSDKLAQQAQQETERIQSQATERNNEIEEATGEKIREEEQELEAQSTVRNEQEKFQFPMYGQAKVQGYHDGEKPSNASELMQREFEQFMASLTNSQKEALGHARNIMSSKQFEDLLSNLFDMSSSERRELFSKLEAISRIGRF